MNIEFKTYNSQNKNKIIPLNEFIHPNERYSLEIRMFIHGIVNSKKSTRELRKMRKSHKNLQILLNFKETIYEE